MKNFEAMPSMDAPQEAVERKPYTTEELALIERGIKDSTGFFGGEVRKAEKAVHAYEEKETSPTETLRTIAHGMEQMSDFEDMGRLDVDRIPEGEKKAKELAEDAIARLAQIRAGRDKVIERNPTVYKELMEGIINGLERDVNAREQGTSATTEKAIEGRIQELRALGNRKYLSQAIVKLEGIRSAIKNITPERGADAIGRLDLKIEMLQKALEKMD